MHQFRIRQTLAQLVALFVTLPEEWIVGYRYFIGLVSSLQAEIWSILIGLQVAWPHDIKRLQMYTDCDQASRLLCASLLETSELSLVQAINSLRNCS
ncbi:hypothetical protein V6N12_015925 [Hibiscus sabdariffa]|uniref:RNase H type-1 domain-containing protein n=1 Tax=Hibiscus sabdariffa TaxID=183260 RepID=A0ABR2DPL6_9ROSI